MPLTFSARWSVSPEKKPEFTAALQELAAAFPPGLLARAKYMNLAWNRKGQFVASECWEDEEAINELRASPAFHNAIRKMTACCYKPLELEILEVFEGDPGVFDRYPDGTADPKYYPDLGAMTAKVV